ncbi:hypothetical protein KKA94_00275 [Patescibacteria group bacterium]|nr:hypothetical protein [Patescibacteria group bacterium]
MSTILRICKKLPSPVRVAEILKPAWLGILVIDGKRVKCYDQGSKRIIKKLTDRERKRLHWFTWIVSIDTLGGDIPNNSMAEEETKIDIVMHLKDLKKMNYPLKAIVSDGVPWYGQCARKIFGKSVVIQHCTRHFLDRCRTKTSLKESKKYISTTTMLIFFIKHIIEADTLDEADVWVERLKLNKHVLVKTKMQKWILNRFKKEAQNLTAHLLYPRLNIPHTNNDAENLIGQAEKRIHLIGRFNHWMNAKDYLNAWTLWRRFTPFTDCKGQRKHRNGKSPLQLSGANTSGVDWLEL